MLDPVELGLSLRLNSSVLHVNDRNLTLLLMYGDRIA